MSGRGVVIHFNDVYEFFGIDDINIITVGDLLKRAQNRFYEEGSGSLVDFDCLCEGPNPFKPLEEDQRLREIVQIPQELEDLNGINQEAGVIQKSVHLWLCNGLIDEFLPGNTSTENEQHHLEDTRSVDDNNILKYIHFSSTYTGSGVPPQASTDAELVQNFLNQFENDDALDRLLEEADAYLKSLEKPSESCNTTNESADDNVFKFTKDFRKPQKKQYKTDVFPLTPYPKTKKNKSTNTEITSQTVNKKRKISKTSKKYAFHLQAEVKKGCQDGRYPRVQLPRHYLDLIEKGQTVSVFVAAIKRINGRRYLDALKGFLIDKKNRRTPLENPCIIKLKWIDRNNPPPKDYPLKLALIQVSGAINRKCKVEYNENFNFAKRIVDERSKYPDDNTTDDTDDTDDTDEPEEFQIVVALAKGDALLEAEWPMLIESDLMHYVIGKSIKMQKTNSSVSASVQGRLQTQQENEEEDNDDDDDDEE